MPDDALDDDGALGEAGFSPPLPPDDRIWRHPSEIGGLVQAARRRREVTNAKLIAFAATASLIGSVLTVGALAAGGAFDRNLIESPVAEVTKTIPTNAFAVSAGTKWPDIVRNLAPSLARVEGAGEASPTLGSAVAFRTTAEGTYFVTSMDLLRNVQRVTLVLNGERRRKGEVVATDQYTNLAVVKVSGEHINPPKSETDTAVQVGSDAVVVGAPRADAPSPTVAKALVGSLDNKVTTKEGTVEGLLRTDANIAADAKGAALVDERGALIGIMVAMNQDETGEERFGFALPVGTMTATADSLIDSGFPTGVWLGIAGRDLTEAAAVPLGVAGGAVLDNVALNSPASACGLLAGDVVIKLNTTAVKSLTRLVMTLRALRPQDTVAIEYVRNGAVERCYAELADPPEAGDDDGANAATRATISATATATTSTTAATPDTTAAVTTVATPGTPPGPASR